MTRKILHKRFAVCFFTSTNSSCNTHTD